jgi:hypothetical protein
MRCLGNHVLIPKQRFGFLRVYNFQFPYPWKPFSVICWFPGISLSMATCLSICFLETAHMSQYVHKRSGKQALLDRLPLDQVV